MRQRAYYTDKLEKWAINDLSPENPDLYDLIVDMRSNRVTWEDIASLLAPHWEGEARALKAMLKDMVRAAPVSATEKQAIANSRLDDLVEVLAPLLESSDDPVRTANSIMRIEEIRAKINNNSPTVVINQGSSAEDMLPGLLDLIDKQSGE